MTSKQFYDWQTAGGTNDVMWLIDVLEKSDSKWCVIGGIAVNHWAKNPMVTQDVDLVITAPDLDRVLPLLEAEGFQISRFEWSVNLKGKSAVNVQISTEDFYRSFPERAVPADVHGILMRVASLEDTLTGKIKAWSELTRRQSKRLKDLADIARLIETHPELRDMLPEKIKHNLFK